MSVIARIEASLRAGTTPSIAELGGPQAILADASTLAVSPLFDVLARAITKGAPDIQVQLEVVILLGFAKNGHPATFRDSFEVIIRNEALRTALPPQLVPILSTRVTDRVTPGNALIAAYALEALFLIALKHQPTRYRVFAIMLELGDVEPDLFAAHAAKLVGSAYHQWGEEALIPVLVRLQLNDEAAGEAAQELAMAALAKALDAPDFEAVIAGVLSARELFALARQTEPERTDTAAYLAVTDLLDMFASDASPGAFAAPLASLDRAIGERRELLGIGHIPDWLRQRTDIETEWWRMLRAARSMAEDLKRPSWLRPFRILEGILAIYDADRTLALGRGLHELFAPRIEASFVQERGLLAHLDDILSDTDWSSPDRAVAERLRSSIKEIPLHRPVVLGSMEDADYPLLDAILHRHGSIDLPRSVAATLEVGLADIRAPRHRIRNPVVHRIYDRLSGQLGACEDYRGNVQADFDDLMLQVVMFCVDRQDADRRSLGIRGDYLRSPTAAEADLQADLRQWLKGNMPEAEVLNEVQGVAGGRTDIYVGFGAHRFIIELKKHEGVVDPGVVQSYRGQAATYQATNVRLGFLGILELVSRIDPPASIEECIWLNSFVPEGGQLVRYLVTFRVPGMLGPPSALSAAPAGNRRQARNRRQPVLPNVS